MANGTIAASQLEMLTQSGTGIITIVPPATNTNRTLTLPDATGTVLTTATAGVPVNGPAFSAYQSTLQSIANTTFVKITCQTEEFDTNSAFDNATNYRFTPAVAGYYQVNGSMGLSASAATTLISVYKNGAEFKRGMQSGAGTNSGNQAIVSVLVYLNGSTDYVELYGYQGSGGAINSTASVTATYFQAALVRSAV